MILMIMIRRVAAKGVWSFCVGRFGTSKGRTARLVANRHSADVIKNTANALKQRDEKLKEPKNSETLRNYADKFPYAKQIAEHINFDLPKINSELPYAKNHKCWLVGYTKRVDDPTSPTDGQTSAIFAQQKGVDQPSQATDQQSDVVDGSKRVVNESEKLLDESKKVLDESEKVGDESEKVGDEQKIQFVKDAWNREQTTFESILNLAKQQDLDVFIWNEQLNQLGLANLQQKVYRQYYFQKLFKSNSTAKTYKQIRLPQKIDDNDIRIKASKIQSILKQGQYKFKLITQNDSQKCELNLKRLSDLLATDIHIKNQSSILQHKSRRQRQIKVDRFVVDIQFQDAVKVDYNYINKKWRRKLIKEKHGKEDRVASQYDDLIDRPLEVQREILEDIRYLGAKVPKEFQQYDEFETILENNPQQFYPTIIKRKLAEIQEMKRKQAENQETEQTEEECEDERQISYKGLRNRTVNEILNEMESIRGEKYQLSSYQVHRLSSLERELKDTLRSIGYKGSL